MNMNLIIKQGTLSGKVTAPPSKSYTHRAFIMGALASGKATTVRSPLYGEDTNSTLSAIAAFGADVNSEKKAGASCFIKGGSLHAPDDVINVNNSGTTLRIMTGVASLLDGMTVFTGDASIRKRPMKPLLDALNELGVDCFSLKGNGCAPILTKGQIKGGMTFISGDVSSQFISSLLISCPFARGDTTLMLTSKMKSRPYVDITIEILSKFGVKIQEKENAFLIKGGQKAKGVDYTVPGDFSSAAFPLVGAAISGGKVTVDNVDHKGAQGDRAIVDILKRLGAKVQIGSNSITVEAAAGRTLTGASVDFGDTPDLFPIVAVLGACAKGETKLYNAKHVRLKESDRVATMRTVLSNMGVSVKEKEDGLIIKGIGGTNKKLKGCEVDSLGDHRILMAAAMAALVCEGEMRISEPECFKVSYPGFLSDMEKLGANCRIV